MKRNKKSLKALKQWMAEKREENKDIETYNAKQEKHQRIWEEKKLRRHKQQANKKRRNILRLMRKAWREWGKK